MISFSSVWAITLRHLRLWKHDPNIPLFFLYWPLLDVLMFGYLGMWVSRSHASEFNNYSLIAIVCLLCFQVCSRGCNYLCTFLNEELWSSNVVNLFSLPLQLAEWICASIIFTAIGCTITAIAGIGFAVTLYDVSFSDLAYNFIVFAPPLFLSCIWLGFTALSFLILFGKRSIELAFVFTWFFLPFCGAYFPIDVLPGWGKTISSFLPMTPVFQGLRGLLQNGQDATPFLIKGYFLGLLYAAVGIALFVYNFNKAKKSGLARLTE
ncbi:hypothetical protein FJ366_03815 [Candidatus Dependentiae bacterium]|nr:hypothetical protein [Candidatus Dependentiae bacterium]